MNNTIQHSASGDFTVIKTATIRRTTGNMQTTIFNRNKQLFEPETWKYIKASIDNLNRQDLEKRYWNLYDNVTERPATDHSIYWSKELEYIKDRLK